MKKINFILFLIRNSMYLDVLFLKVSPWPIYKKINFLLIKNMLVIKHFFVKFRLGLSKVFFDGQFIYYDSRFGLAGYQALMSRSQSLLKLAGIKKVKTIIDIGANVGFFSMLCRNLYRNANIYAVEPVPQTFGCLKNNLSIHKKNKLYNLGISNHTGRAKIKFDENNSAISSIHKNGNIDIKITTLDNLVKKNKIKEIDILKIDTENYEYQVLKGAKKVLENTKYLFIEISLEKNSNYTLSSLMSLLYSKKYNFQLIAFRNFADVSYGKITVIDALLENINLVS